MIDGYVRPITPNSLQGDSEPWVTERQREEMIRLYFKIITDAEADITFPELVLALLRQKVREMGL